MTVAGDRSNDALAQVHTEVLELYKVAVECADRISSRRGSANQFFLTFETLLLGVPALYGGKDARPLGLAMLAAVGIVVSVAWWLQLRSYRQLNAAKFLVISEIESTYFEVKPFSREWDFLKKDPIKGWRGRYAELGTVERLVPGIFAALNIFLLVRAAVS